MTVKVSVEERDRAEGAFREQRHFAERLVETAHAIIVVLDTQGRIVLLNPYMAEISGYSLDEVRGKDWFATFLPDRDRDHIREVFQTAVSDIDIRANINPILTKSGEEREIEWYGKTLKDADDRVVGVLSVGQDITDRLRSEEELRRREARLESLIRTTQDGVIFIDGQARITRFNDAAEKMFGYRAAEIVGERINRLMPQPHASEHDDYIERYERTGEARAIGRIRTASGVRRDGTEFPIELSVTELAVDQEVRYAAFIRDISKQVRLQRQALERERLAAVGITAAKFVHEIGNPLNAMSMNAQLLKRRLAQSGDRVDDRVHASLAAVSEEIERLARLLDEFRSMSRRQRFDFSTVDPATLLLSVVDVHRARFDAAGIEVRVELPDTLPPVSADAEKIKQVLINLIVNAVEAMRGGGSLRVSARSSERLVTLEIADSGCGIPDDLDVFEPFATTKSAGTGLGLAIARQIMAAHHGDIDYENARPHGTVFSLTLPRLEATDA